MIVTRAPAQVTHCTIPLGLPYFTLWLVDTENSRHFLSQSGDAKPKPNPSCTRTFSRFGAGCKWWLLIGWLSLRRQVKTTLRTQEYFYLGGTSFTKPYFSGSCRCTESGGRDWRGKGRPRNEGWMDGLVDAWLIGGWMDGWRWMGWWVGKWMRDEWIGERMDMGGWITGDGWEMNGWRMRRLGDGRLKDGTF